MKTNNLTWDTVLDYRQEDTGVYSPQIKSSLLRNGRYYLIIEVFVVKKILYFRKVQSKIQTDIKTELNW